MIWELVLIMGITWAGVGAQRVSEYPSEDSCYRALREMKTGDSPIMESNQKKNTVAFCRPKTKEKTK